MEISRNEFLGLMTKLCVAFRQKNDPNRLEFYWQALRGFTCAQLTTAVDEQINRNVRFPRIAELRGSVPWTQTPRRASPPPLPFIRDDPEHAAASFALIQRILRERMPAHERLVEFKKMAARWPQYAWQDAVKETEAIVAHADYRAQKAKEDAEDRARWPVPDAPTMTEAQVVERKRLLAEQAATVMAASAAEKAARTPAVDDDW